MNKKLFLLGALSLGLALNVNAAETTKNSNPEIEGYKIKFKEMDKNGRGYITEKEYIKYQNQGWKLMDEMEVGYINKDEYNNAKDGKKFETKKFEELDFNKDGRLTKGEYELNQKVDFAKGDKNGDAKLSEYEYISAKKAELKYNFKEKTPQGSVKEKYKYKVNE